MIFYDSWLAKLILFGDHHTIMLFGGIFTKKKALSSPVIQHEKTHQIQFLEVMEVFQALFILADAILFIVGVPETTLVLMLVLTILVPPLMYYVVYGVEWLVSIIHWFFSKKKKDIVEANGKAYRNSAMEMEARFNERVKDYLLKRRPFAFIKYYGLI